MKFLISFFKTLGVYALLLAMVFTFFYVKFVYIDESMGEVDLSTQQSKTVIVDSKKVLEN